MEPRQKATFSDFLVVAGIVLAIAVIASALGWWRSNPPAQVQFNQFGDPVEPYTPVDEALMLGVIGVFAVASLVGIILTIVTGRDHIPKF